jgi:hypothetical protein
VPYAHIVNGELVEIRDELPSSAQRLDTLEVVTDLVKWGPATGWFPTDAVFPDPDSQKDLFDEFRAAKAEREARARYIDQVAGQARHALAANEAIRAANVTFREAVDTFLDAAVPATTADRLTFLYTNLRALANGSSSLTTEIDTATVHMDGVIRLLGNVVPALSDLLDAAEED